MRTGQRPLSHGCSVGSVYEGQVPRNLPRPEGGHTRVSARQLRKDHQGVRGGGLGLGDIHHGAGSGGGAQAARIRQEGDVPPGVPLS